MTRNSGGRLGLGVDVGGTFTKIVAVDERGRALEELQVPTEPEAGPEAFVSRVSRAARGIEASLGRRFSGAGLGLAGDVDAETGLLRFAPNLGTFNGFRFKGAFERRLGRPVAVENDANMATWGGYVIELGRRPRTMVGITMGTGIGGGIVIDGRLHHGATGSAGEIGHGKVTDGGETCHCGARGCLEAYAGSYAIVRAAAALRGRRGSPLARLAPEPEMLDTRLIALAAQRGDAGALAVWRRTGRYLGIGVANAVYLLNPDVVLIMGGVSRAGSLVLGPIRRVLRDQAFKTPFRRVRVAIARTPNLGALGAGLFGLERES